MLQITHLLMQDYKNVFSFVAELKNNYTMANEASSTGKFWLMFIISLIGTIAFLWMMPEWFWVMLPFLGTSFVYAMDWV